MSNPPRVDLDDRTHVEWDGGRFYVHTTGRVGWSCVSAVRLATYCESDPSKCDTLVRKLFALQDAAIIAPFTTPVAAAVDALNAERGT